MKQKIILEFLAIALALGITLVISNSLFFPTSPAVNPSFIAQMENKAQTFIADTLNALNNAQTQTTSGRAPATISSNKEDKSVSVSFPNGFTYKLENGVYR